MKDLMGIMKQVQSMQAKMADMQTELDNTVVEGQSGGGMVRVSLTGKGALKGLSIDPSLLNKDEAEILEDLIVAAHADAKAKSEAMMADKMKGLTGGLPLAARLQTSVLSVAATAGPEIERLVPTARQIARPRAALGAARGAASRTQAARTAGTARRCHGDCA